MVASGLPPQAAVRRLTFWKEECALDKENRKPTYFALFAHTFTLSAFTIGGGYVMIPLMKERFVDKLKWITCDELAEITALGQSSPGAMIINTTVLMGYRQLGFWGAVCALLGTALPPLIILSAVSYFYDIIRGNRFVSAAFRGMQAGISAVIADTVVCLAVPYIKKDEVPYILIMAGAFAAAWFFDINVALIIIACGLLGLIIGTVQRKRGKKT